MQTKQKPHFETSKQTNNYLVNKHNYQTCKQTQVIIFLIKAILGLSVFIIMLELMMFSSLLGYYLEK